MQRHVGRPAERAGPGGHLNGLAAVRPRNEVRRGRDLDVVPVAHRPVHVERIGAAQDGGVGKVHREHGIREGRAINSVRSRCA